MKTSGFTPEELEKFKEYQRASYAVLEGVARELREGESEKAVTRRIRKRFHEQGVHYYFHVPVALFGARTAYPGDFGQLEALPTDQKLERGMPVILDAAAGLPRLHGGHLVRHQLRRQPAGRRAGARAEAAARPDPGSRARARQLPCHRTRSGRRDPQAGYENCHKKHIAFVLGHRITQAPDTWWHRRRVWGLGVPQAAYFVGKTFGAQQFGGDGSPNWNHTRTSDHPPTPGLWAVEPHVGKDGVGAKFEEILVITGDDAWWLDEGGLPHHRAWAS